MTEFAGAKSRASLALTHRKARSAPGFKSGRAGYPMSLGLLATHGTPATVRKAERRWLGTPGLLQLPKISRFDQGLTLHLTKKVTDYGACKPGHNIPNQIRSHP